MGRRKPSRRGARAARSRSGSEKAPAKASPPREAAPEAPKPPRDWAEIGRAYGLLLFSAVLMFLGFAGFGVWPLAFIGMVPALFVIDGHTGGRRPPSTRDVDAPPGTDDAPRPMGWTMLRRSLFFGYVAYYGGFYWVVNTIVDFGGFPYLLALAFASIYFLYQAFEFVLILWLWKLARERGFNATLSLVAAYLAAELAFPTLFDHFYGNSFHMLPWLIQVADLGGPMLLTALAMAGNGALYEVLRARLRREPIPWRSPAVFAGAFLFCVGYSAWRTGEVEARMAAAPSITVGVVQTNMGIFEKREDPGEGLRRHLEQSRHLEEEHDLDLLVWPESAATFALPRGEGVDAFGAFENALRFYRLEGERPPTTPLLFGGLSTDRGEDGERVLYNTAFITDEAGVVQAHYDKTYLLAFGEYLPFGDLLPILYDWSPNTGHFTPGDHVRPLPLGEHRVSALVCYEDILPSFVRRAVREGDPHLLVNVTNDAWFGDTHEPYVHLALAKMRAVEHHRTLVRATNTGVSAIIDPLGRPIAEGLLFDRWSGAADVPLLEDATVYELTGDWPGWLGLGAMIYLGFVGRRAPRDPAPEPPEAPPQRARRREDEALDEEE